MKRLLLFMFLITLFGAQAQNNYRFSVGGGFHSMMFWGFRSFEDVVCPKENDVLRIYEHEEYDLDYKNFASSMNYSYNVSINWICRKKWMLAQRFSFFKGNLNDELTLSLTDIGDGYLSYYPIVEFNATNTGVGSVSNIHYRTEISGFSGSLICYKRSKIENLQLGFGLNLQLFSAKDFWWNGFEETLKEGYRPAYLERGSSYYGTQQIGLSVNSFWNWHFIQLYLNFSNNIITLKREENKGQWYGDFNFFPTSHNFDYRFPLTIETGIALSFDKIKKKR